MKTLALALLVSFTSMADEVTMNVLRVLTLNGDSLLLQPEGADAPPVPLKLCPLPDENKITLRDEIRYAFELQKAFSLKLDRELGCVLSIETYMQRNLPH